MKNGNAMRRLFAFLLLVIMLLQLAGCGLKERERERETNLETLIIKDAQSAIEQLAEQGEQEGYQNALSELTEKSTTEIDGDSYYRLQQNYQGIPVYGRTIVCATDEDGNVTSITGNVLDVDEDVDTNPTLTIDGLTAEIEAYAIDILGFSTDECALNILSYELVWYIDSSDHTALAYSVCVYIGGDPYDIIVDANTGDVYSVNCKIMTESVSVNMSVDGYEHEVNLWQEDDGSYITYDAENNIRVLSANGETLVRVLVYELATGEKYSYNCYTKSWYDESGATCTMPTDPYVSLAIEFTTEENLIGVTQPTFTDLEILDQGACRMLFFTTVANDYFSRILFRDGWGDGNATTLQVVFDCANGSYHYSPKCGISMLSIESGSSLNTVVHELTHAMESTESDMTYSGESGAIMEALSDIFAEIVEHDFIGKCDWLYNGGLRNLIDPSQSTESNMAHPAKYKGENWYSGDQDYGGVHINSTVISHAAYLMSTDGGGLLTMDELAKLWYRAMLMMPSDCDFAMCRKVVEYAAESMHTLTEEQRACIGEAFDCVGIQNVYDTNDGIGQIEYRLLPNSLLYVYDVNNELHSGYTLNIYGPIAIDESGRGARIMAMQLNNQNVIVTEAAPYALDLGVGVYKIGITDAYSDVGYSFTVQICEDATDQEIILLTPYDIPLIVEIPNNTTEDSPEPGKQEGTKTGEYEMREEVIEFKLADGTLYYSNTVSYPYFFGNSAAEIAINNRYAAIIAEFKNNTTDYEAEYQQMQEYGLDGFPFYDDVIAEVTYCDNGIISIKERAIMWSGGMHEYSSYKGYTYFVENGAELTLNDILLGSESEMRALVERYNRIADIGYKAKTIMASPFVLTSEGLCFICNIGDAIPREEIVIPFTEKGAFAIFAEEKRPAEHTYVDYSAVLDQYRTALATNYGTCGDYVSSDLEWISHAGGMYDIYYARQDLNGDGVDELIIGGWDDHWDEMILFSIFGHDGQSPVLIEGNSSYGHRGELHIFVDGTFMSEGSGGADTYGYEYYHIEDGSCGAVLSKGFGTMMGEPYYRDASGNKITISEDELRIHCNREDPAEMEFAWTPIS